MLEKRGEGGNLSPSEERRLAALENQRGQIDLIHVDEKEAAQKRAAELRTKAAELNRRGTIEIDRSWSAKSMDGEKSRREDADTYFREAKKCIQTAEELARLNPPDELPIDDKETSDAEFLPEPEKNCLELPGFVFA